MNRVHQTLFWSCASGFMHYVLAFLEYHSKKMTPQQPSSKPHAQYLHQAVCFRMQYPISVLHLEFPPVINILDLCMACWGIINELFFLSPFRPIVYKCTTSRFAPLICALLCPYSFKQKLEVRVRPTLGQLRCATAAICKGVIWIWAPRTLYIQSALCSGILIFRLRLKLSHEPLSIFSSAKIPNHPSFRIYRIFWLRFLYFLILVW